jgi:putative pyruvate formate lyase activating enzyme
MMLTLQRDGAHNINLVTPTHYVPQILDALLCALERGLTLPIVYNTSGYDTPEIIDLLSGIVDIYLADIKYATRESAGTCSNAPDYPNICFRAVKNMASQVSTEYTDAILTRGLIIRHLVLPNHCDESKTILSWIRDNVPGALTSVMFQYRPYYHAHRYPLIDRAVNYAEYRGLADFAESLDLQGWIQDFDPPEDLAGVHFSPQ